MGTDKENRDSSQKYVVVMRGLIREHRHWGPYQAMLEAALPDVQIINMDIPGNGLLHEQTSMTCIDDNVDYVRAQFKEKVPNDASTGLIAMSLGGMIATAWMQKYPDDFDRALLINTSFSGLSPFYHRMQLSAAAKVIPARFKSSPEASEEAIIDVVSNSPHKKEELLPVWVRLAQESPVKKRNALRQLYAGLRYRPNLKEKPKTPILLLAGKGDRLCSYRCSEAIAAHWFLPIRLHDSGGHELHHDAPDWTFQNIQEWFSELA